MATPAAVLDAVDRMWPPLLGTLERVEWVQRHLYPPAAARLGEALAPGAGTVAAALRDVEAQAWPETMRFMRDRLVAVGHQTIALVEAFAEAARTPENAIGLYRALRRFAGVQENLYPLAPAFEPVSRWFLEPARRDDDAHVERLREGALRSDDVRVGVLHASHAREERGGFSLYVPESWDGRAAMPLVVALHGGFGHGRDFLWSWLREGRTRGMLVMAPTSRARTWSLAGADVDAEALRDMVASVGARYPVDRSHVLLTGMSDGATYALMCGLRDDMPFTHLATACGVLHPRLLVDGGLARAQDRPVYVVHGALDWMFPVTYAQMARDALLAAGAKLVYRELPDLSHTYPRDENGAILDWLMSR